MDDYLKINKEAWDRRTEIHMQSAFYDLNSFLEGENSLPAIDRQLLGDVRGKSVLHLQCHFGMDSISLSRMGAKVTAIDFSEKAIKKAKELNRQLGTDVEFVCCDVYDTLQYVSQQFDVVYTSYGVISWLPDLMRWAKVVSDSLKPQGKFIMIEFHPILWMFDGTFEKVLYPYAQDQAFVMEEKTYTDNAGEAVDTTVTWNHGLAEVFRALKSSGLIINQFLELPGSPFNLFANMVETSEGIFQIAGKEGLFPITFAISGDKKSLPDKIDTIREAT